MSDFRFGFDDYRLNYYPSDATDGMGGVDWDNVERVEIEYDMYVKERTCENVFPGSPIDKCMMFQCSVCGHVKTNGTYPPEWWYAKHTDDECATYDGEPIRFCPHCGARVKAVER